MLFFVVTQDRLLNKRLFASYSRRHAHVTPPWRILTMHAITYRQTSNIRGTLVGNKIADHSDVVVAAPVQLYLHSRLNAWLQWIGKIQLQDETRNIWVWGFGATYTRSLTVDVSLCGRDTTWTSTPGTVADSVMMQQLYVRNIIVTENYLGQSYIFLWEEYHYKQRTQCPYVSRF